MRAFPMLLALAVAVAALPTVTPSQDFSVGVIAGANGCPMGSQWIHVYMDEEDQPGSYTTQYPYGSYMFRSIAPAWYGKSWAGGSWENWDNAGGCNLEFCKVSGLQLKPLTSAPDASRNYAVLKLGTKCPPGSVDFDRFFDNEDYDNMNSGNVAFPPNDMGLNTHLFFCLFRSGATTMSEFPNLGREYGVLVNDFSGTDPRVTFPWGTGFGGLQCDDEDWANANSFNPKTGDVWTDATRIVKPFRDGVHPGGMTWLYLAKVSSGTCQTATPPANVGQPCGTCGGFVQCDGTCSVPTPVDAGKPCGSCGGIRACDGTCSVPTPSNFGQACGSCGGTITCAGTCSIRTPSNLGAFCGCGGTVECGGCTDPKPASGYCP